jgi:allophanate hydrolase subunit 1
VVPALCGIAVHFDPYHPALPAPLLEKFEQLLHEVFRSASKFEDNGRIVEVPVCYDPVFGLDLKEISEKTSVPPEEIRSGIRNPNIRS